MVCHVSICIASLLVCHGLLCMCHGWQVQVAARCGAAVIDVQEGLLLDLARVQVRRAGSGRGGCDVVGSWMGEAGEGTSDRMCSRQRGGRDHGGGDGGGEVADDQAAAGVVQHAFAAAGEPIHFELPSPGTCRYVNRACRYACKKSPWVR